jgi:hypothetical protein
MDETERRFVSFLFGGVAVILMMAAAIGMAAGLAVWAFRMTSGL